MWCVVTIVYNLYEASDRKRVVKMVIALSRCASLTLLLSAMSTLVRSQAPGDAESQWCTKPPVPDGVVRLLDTGWYATLLTGGINNAGWTQTPAGSVSE